MKKINIKLASKKFIHWLKSIGSDADNDWKLILSTSIITFIFLIGASLQIFFTVQHQKATGTSAKARGTGFVDAKGLTNVLNKYGTRAKEYSNLMATTTPFVDPSR